MNENELVYLEESLSPDRSLTLTESKSGNSKALCTLTGPVADYRSPTRNGRNYEEELWDRVMSLPEIREMFETKTFFGEADHPGKNEGRLEVSLPLVSHVVTDWWKNPQEGTIEANFDILDTPSGRIIKSLVDYGCKIGASTRGAGKVISRGGRQIVEASTYKFVTIDLVAMPSVKKSRMVETGVPEKVGSPKFYESVSKQVDDLIERNDKANMSVIKSLLESFEGDEFRPLVEKLETALNPETYESEAVSLLRNDLDEAYTVINSMKEEIKTLRESVTKEPIEIPNDDLVSRIVEVLKEVGDLREVFEMKISEVTTALSVKEQLAIKQTELSNLLTKVEDLEESLRVSERARASAESASSSLISKLRTVLNLDESEGADRIVEMVSMLIEEADNLLEQINQSQINESAELIASKDQTISSLRDMVKSLSRFRTPYIRMKCQEMSVDPSIIIPLITESMTIDQIDTIIANTSEKTKRIRRMPISLSTNPKGDVVILDESKDMNTDQKKKSHVATVAAIVKAAQS